MNCAGNLDEMLGNKNTSIQEIIDLNREITILKEDIFQIKKDNEIQYSSKSSFERDGRY